MLPGRWEISPDKVAAYIRWSTDEQGLGTTLEVQRDRLRLYILSQGWQFRDELVFVDDGYSGGTVDRPALGRLRAAVRDGLVHCVVVYRLDRLSRSLRDTVNLVRGEWEGRAALFSATENFDTHSPVGRMILNMLASFAEFERSLIRERTLSGKRKRAEQGRNAGQPYPLGYRKGPDSTWALDGWDERRRLTGPAALVRRIFEAFLSGMGTGAIARMLNAEGIATPQGKRWRFHYIVRILKNSIYAGLYRYGQAARPHPAAGDAPAIVTEAEFAQVQAMLSGRQVARSPAGEYLLTGLARCGGCGDRIAGSRGRGKRYYVCTGRTILHQCDCGYLHAAALEHALLAEIQQWVLQGTTAVDAVSLQERWEWELAGRQAALREAEAQWAALVRRRQRLEDEFLDGRVDGAAYSRMSARLESDAQRLNSQCAEALQAVRLLENGASQRAALAAQINPWSELSADEARQVIRLLSVHLTVYRPVGGSAIRVTWQRKQASDPPAT